MKKYYLASLILMTAILAIAGLQKGETQNLRNEKTIEYLKQNGSYDSLAEAVTAARYKIEQNGETLGANNPANQMSAQFDESGNLRLSGTGQNWQTVFRLKSFGRGAEQSAVGGGTWQAKENRVENRRAEFGLTEYFENRADGLEQGFILDTKPAGDENLSLTLQTSGGLRAKASDDGQKIVLSDETGVEVLDYDKLKVWDANQTDLTARMTTDETGEIRFEVEDRSAVYPLTIDPTFVQRQKLTANDGAAFNEFGYDVAIAGDTAVVGSVRDDINSNTNQGSAYVFVRNGSVWTQQAKLVANDGSTDDNFGYSVAISGDTIIVGSPFDNVNSQINRGSAYIFVRNGTSWIPQEKLIASDGATNDNFGYSVSISGDTVLIGVYSDDVGTNTDQGSAYIFVRNGGAWTQQQKLTASDGGLSDYFGEDVFLSSGTAIIGASLDDIGSNTEQGSAYIFVRSGTTWTQQTKLTASDGAADDGFGNSVALSLTLSGTVAVIGANFDEVAGNSGQGSVYVFSRSTSGIWSQTQKLIANDGAAGDLFGNSVAISSLTASTIIVGAYFDDVGTNSDQGSVYVYKRADSVWTQAQKLTASDGAVDDLFGVSVALSGETLIVGANLDNVGSNTNQGSAYILELGNASPFDFDGDSKTDIGIFRPAPGEWWINRSSTGQTFATQFGQTSDRISPADFTGDGKTDVAFWRPSTGNWFVLRSEDSTFFSFPFGANGDTPVPADYDGDGKADAAVFRSSTLTWFINKSSGGTDIITFGASGDKPVIGDYDGDGKADIAIFRPNGATGGEWWIRRSSNASVFALQFGTPTDKAVQGDYTGDGKTDIAFWRPSNGNWFILRSEDFSFYAFPFGANGDTPVAGDYDGDGKFDAGVFRPTDSTWYINRSTAGTLIQQFGIAGDKPLPNAFVP